MKTIKIILVIISLFFLTFLATGLLVKETNYTVQVSVQKPLKEVFNSFSEIDSIQHWIPEIKSTTTVDQKPGITGSIYRLELLNKGQKIMMNQKIMAYVPHEKLTIFYDVENMLKKNDYLFSENKGVTTITLHATCQSNSYIMACVFPYFKSTFIAQDQVYLNNFKAYLED